jgi:hypothetical protein
MRGCRIEHGAACVVDEVEDVASLLTEGRVDGEDAFDDAAALFGVRAVAGLAIENAVAHGALGERAVAHPMPPPEHAAGRGSGPW